MGQASHRRDGLEQQSQRPIHKRDDMLWVNDDQLKDLLTVYSTLVMDRLDFIAIVGEKIQDPPISSSRGPFQLRILRHNGGLFQCLIFVSVVVPI